MRSNSDKVVKVVTGSLTKIGNTAWRNLDPLDVLRAYFELRSKTEEEQTRREEIRANRDVAVAAIVANKALLEEYFSQRFAERRAVLDQLFSVLAHGVDTQNDVQLDHALDGILAVVRDNPLSDFATFREARAKGQILEI